jgi:hypothetical protein
MHLCAKDYDNAKNFLREKSGHPKIPLPTMPSRVSPIKQLEELVKLEAKARHAAAGFANGSFERTWLPAAEKLEPYWRQLYYILLLEMCRRVEYAAGPSRLQEFIDVAWLQYLPSDIYAERPTQRSVVGQTELFGGEALRDSSGIGAIHRPLKTSTPAAPEPLQDSTSVSRDELERELDRVLKGYKPLIAREQWSQIEDYRGQFLERALASPARASQVLLRLQQNALITGEGEKAEGFRGPAKPFINRLEDLLR